MVDPGAMSSRSPAISSCTRGRRLSTTLGVNCFARSRRRRVWTGGSVVETIGAE